MNVPKGRLFPGSLRSPDILTPWVKPVTAGKKMAKRIQKPGMLGGDAQLAARMVLSHVVIPPIKKEVKEATRVAMTTY
jgi:hypothetical protein